MVDAKPPVIRKLVWDSDRFGIPVGELDVEGAETDAVHAVLDKTGREFDLIYVRNANAADISPEVMKTFHGERTDVRATFELSPIAIPECGDVTALGSVRPMTKEDASPHRKTLTSLARQVSEHSRFRNDSRFPANWIADLYEGWLESSLAKEQADEVLVFEGVDGPLGLYTIKVDGTSGNLVLFAVDTQHRGQGIGAALAVAGLEWMRQHGLVRATVTTQLDNPACKLYRGFGYKLMKTEEIYHLWPNAAQNSDKGSLP